MKEGAEEDNTANKTGKHSPKTKKDFVEKRSGRRRRRRRGKRSVWGKREKVCGSGGGRGCEGREGRQWNF
jgi:hypothetical protein